MLALGIFITHGLACYVAIDITWNDYIGKKLGNSSRKLLWEYVVRTLLVLVTCKLNEYDQNIAKISKTRVKFEEKLHLAAVKCRILV